MEDSVTVEETRQEESELFFELSINDGMEAKLDMILAKLNKLDIIEATLNNICAKVAKVESEVAKLKTDEVESTRKVNEMEKSLTWFNSEMQSLQHTVKELETARDFTYEATVHGSLQSQGKLKIFWPRRERDKRWL